MLGAAVVLAGGLSGCVPVITALGVAGGAAIASARIYCLGTSDAGKAAVRGALTGGQPLIACPPESGAAGEMGAAP